MNDSLKYFARHRVSLSLVPLTLLATMPTIAQQNEVGNAIIENLDFSATDAIPQRIQKLEAQIDALADMRETTRENRENIAELTSAIGELAKLIKASVQDTGALADQDDDSSAVIENQLFNQALESIKLGEWTQDLSSEIIETTLNAALEGVKDAYDSHNKYRRAYDEQIREDCQDETTQWTAELAAAAVRKNEVLPDCLVTEDGEPNDDLRKFMAEEQAFQQVIEAFNSMLLVAALTGNPFIVAIAVGMMAFAAIMSNFDDGSGINGDDGGSGNNGSVSEKPSVEPNPPGNGKEPSVEPNPPGNGNSGSYYPNVAEGFGATVSVSEFTEKDGLPPIIIFDSTSSDNRLVVRWGPPLLPTGGKLPEFSEDVQFDSVDFLSGSFSVTMPIPGCGETPVSLSIRSDGEQQRVDGDIVDRPCIGPRED